MRFFLAVAVAMAVAIAVAISRAVAVAVAVTISRAVAVAVAVTISLAIAIALGNHTCTKCSTSPKTSSCVLACGKQQEYFVRANIRQGPACAPGAPEWSRKNFCAAQDFFLTSTRLRPRRTRMVKKKIFTDG